MAHLSTPPQAAPVSQVDDALAALVRPGVLLGSSTSFCIPVFCSESPDVPYTSARFRRLPNNPFVAVELALAFASFEEDAATRRRGVFRGRVAPRGSVEAVVRAAAALAFRVEAVLRSHAADVTPLLRSVDGALLVPAQQAAEDGHGGAQPSGSSSGGVSLERYCAAVGHTTADVLCQWLRSPMASTPAWCCDLLLGAIAATKPHVTFVATHLDGLVLRAAASPTSADSPHGIAPRAINFDDADGGDRGGTHALLESLHTTYDTIGTSLSKQWSHFMQHSSAAAGGSCGGGSPRAHRLTVSRVVRASADAPARRHVYVACAPNRWAALLPQLGGTAAARVRVPGVFLSRCDALLQTPA